ncbi:Type IV fimbrial assembly protein PilC [Cronobacter condimenti 1330]|uniref:Type IV fimbrial assembly protein PilC n=1 Tax=Cronobacter condimenti 1330 TaxID=1073999 RepID=K8A2U6_9ENTR|nr:protein transport protein HofC [Cronobacter condimenti]ALB61668.1 type IV pilin biogenesis protein [Cronobacter condimenti 1330]CCJ73670.1 Type IV fimbrial assembly protein PilC [Cronobacter condimenti 1330]
MDNQLWRWRGVNKEGAGCTGMLWAQDKVNASLQLLDSDIHPLSLKRASVNKRHWNSEHKILVIRQLAALLQAGVSLTQGLTMLASQHPVAQWQALLGQLAKQLGRGVAFSETLRQWTDIFPPLYISLMQTGELTGKLDVCCQQLAQQQEDQQRLRKQVIKALRYPAFIFAVALLLTLGMTCFVLPQFTAIYRSFNTPLPLITRAVIAFSEGLMKYAVWWLCVMLLVVMVIIRLRRRPQWQLQEAAWLLKLPLFGPLIRGQQLSQIYTVLSLMQRAGIPLLQSLSSVEETLASPLWRQAVSRVKTCISGGLPLWKALEREWVFTALCIQLIRTGEETGALDMMLEKLAGWHLEQTSERAQTLAATLEPLMMIAIGLIVGTLVVAMYLPIFRLGDAMSGMN